MAVLQTSFRCSTSKLALFVTPDAPTDGNYICRRVRIPASLDWLAMVSGALMLLSKVYNWEQVGSLTPDEAAQQFGDIAQEAIQTGDWCMIGEIKAFATVDAPPHMLPCDGASYLREDYPRLYAVLPPSLIIDADHFETPALYERFLVGASYNPMDGIQPFAYGGEAEHQLIGLEMPSHQHIIPSLTVGLAVAPGELVVEVPNLFEPVGFTEPAGGDEPHNNMPPYFAVKYFIVAE